MRKLDDDKAPDLHEQVGPPPSVPAGFWGEVIYRYQDGAAVYVEVRQTSPIKKS